MILNRDEIKELCDEIKSKPGYNFNKLVRAIVYELNINCNQLSVLLDIGVNICRSLYDGQTKSTSWDAARKLHELGLSVLPFEKLKECQV